MIEIIDSKVFKDTVEWFTLDDEDMGVLEEFLNGYRSGKVDQIQKGEPQTLNEFFRRLFEV